MVSCPLCKNENIINIETIDKNILVHLYKKFIGLDCSYLINQNLDYCECENCKLRFFDPLITGDEKFYNSLQKLKWYYMDEKEEYSEAIKHIKPTDKVLEIGSGKGAFAKYIESSSYVGLDFSEKAKEMAERNGVVVKNEAVQSYAQKHEEEFDVVVSFQVLEHVSDSKSFIESQLQALKTGGKLIIAVPSEDSFLKYVNNGALNMPPHHVTRWSDSTFEFIAEKYGLSIVGTYHEKVQEVHKHWYLKTLIENRFFATKLVDISLFRMVSKKVIGLMATVFLNALRDEMLPNGHTVLVVIKK